MCVGVGAPLEVEASWEVCSEGRAVEGDADGADAAVAAISSGSEVEPAPKSSKRSVAIQEEVARQVQNEEQQQDGGLESESLFRVADTGAAKE